MPKNVVGGLSYAIYTVAYRIFKNHNFIKSEAHRELLKLLKSSRFIPKTTVCFLAVSKRDVSEESKHLV